MKRLIYGATLAAAVLTLGLAGRAEAQNRSTMAIMPTQYFSADAASAKNVTEGLAQQFGPQGYQVLGTDRSRAAFAAMGLKPSRHYPDRTAIQFGRRMGAELVAYPRLLVLGVPISGRQSGMAAWNTPAAVLHLRVLNTRTGRAVYFRQIAHRFEGRRLAGGAFTLPQPAALAAAGAVTENYFSRVAGSREEMGRPRAARRRSDSR